MLKRFFMVAILGLFTQLASGAEQFDQVAAKVKDIGKRGDIPTSNEDKLFLYARFTRVKSGAWTEVAEKTSPSRANFVERSKYNSWKNLPAMSADEAKIQYVRKAKDLYTEIADEFGE